MTSEFEKLLLRFLPYSTTSILKGGKYYLFELLWLTEFCECAFVDCDKYPRMFLQLEQKASRLIQPTWSAIFNRRPLNTLCPIWASKVVLNRLNSAAVGTISDWLLSVYWIDTNILTKFEHWQNILIYIYTTSTYKNAARPILLLLLLLCNAQYAQ